ncbi:MAG: arylsulfatase [Planctomycetaceae bacterium]
MTSVYRTLLWILLLLTAVSAACAENAQRPNIVILYADDMGWGDLGVQNPDSKSPTPHLDQLAHEGTRFIDAHSSSGICTPSRYALLHGRYHWRKFHGIVNSFDQSVMDADRLTVAEILKGKGYRTACIGKWHLGWDWEAIRNPAAQPVRVDKRKTAWKADAFDWSKPIPDGPLAHGFDYYFGDDVPNFPPYAWIENDRVITTPTVQLTTTAATAEGSWEARPGPSVKDWDFWAVMPTLTTKAVDWIHQQSADQPFFLYFPFTSPHAPIVPTKDFEGKSQANGYGDFMVQTDDTVGQVLAALKEKGFDKNTLVIFTADNGPERYAYDRVKNHQHRSMGPLRGLKRDLWEGGHRVPFVVRWPGVVQPEGVSDGLISQIDIHATICGIVGAEIPQGTAEDSYDQLPLLKGQASQRHTIVHNTNASGYALRHDNWVLIQAKSGGVSAVPDWFDTANGYEKETHPAALYDLSADISQKHDLSSKHPDKVTELQQMLKTLQNHSQVR